MGLLNMEEIEMDRNSVLYSYIYVKKRFSSRCCAVLSSCFLLISYKTELEFC